MKGKRRISADSTNCSSLHVFRVLCRRANGKYKKYEEIIRSKELELQKAIKQRRNLFNVMDYVGSENISSCTLCHSVSLNTALPYQEFLLAGPGQ